MRNLSIIFFGCLLLAATHAHAQATAQQAEVQQTIIRMFDGLSALDTAAIQQCVTRDFIILENGVIWNMDTLAAKLAPLKKVSFTRVNQLDFIRTEITGNTAWVAYHNTADYTINGQKMSKHWLESASLIKAHGIWKVMLLHSTVVQPGH